MDKKIWIAVTIVICAIAALGYAFMSPKADDKKDAKAETSKPVAVQSEPTQAKTTSPEDGAAPAPSAVAKEVSVTTTYKSPAGEDRVGFTLTVDANGVVTGAKTQVMTDHEISKKRQQAFADGLPAAIKGKKLSELTSIDRVGGSSLTTGAFNQSLAQLKSQL
jgi:NifU-like protein involved in Fe-S cluster formation